MPEALNETKFSETPVEKQVISPTCQLNSIRFDRDGQTIAGGGFQGDVHLWSVAGESASELPTVTGHHAWVHGLSFSPTTSRLFSADSWGQLRATDLDGETATAAWHNPTAHDGWIRQLAVTPDGKQLVSCGMDRVVRIWSADDGRLLRALRGHEFDVHAVAVHPDGKTLVSGDDRGQIKQWEIASGNVVRQFDATELYLLHRIQDVGGVRALSFSGDGMTLAAGGTRPKNGATVQGTPVALLFDGASSKLLHRMELGATKDCFVHELHLRDDGCVIAVTSGTPGAGQILIQHPNDNEPRFRHTKLANCRSLAMRPDGKGFAVLATNKGSNGNGRRLNTEGEYAGNTTPIHLFELA